MNAILVCKDCGSTDIKLVYCNATVVIGQRPDGEKFIINIEDYDDVQLCRCNSCGNDRYCGFESKEEYESKLQPPSVEKVAFKCGINESRKYVDELSNKVHNKWYSNPNKYDNNVFNLFKDTYSIYITNYNKALSEYDNSNLNKAQEILVYIRQKLIPLMDDLSKEFQI